MVKIWFQLYTIASIRNSIRNLHPRRRQVRLEVSCACWRHLHLVPISRNTCKHPMNFVHICLFSCDLRLDVLYVFMWLVLVGARQTLPVSSSKSVIPSVVPRMLVVCVRAIHFIHFVLVKTRVGLHLLSASVLCSSTRARARTHTHAHTHTHTHTHAHTCTHMYKPMPFACIRTNAHAHTNSWTIPSPHQPQHLQFQHILEVMHIHSNT